MNKQNIQGPELLKRAQQRLVMDQLSQFLLTEQVLPIMRTETKDFFKYTLKPRVYPGYAICLYTYLNVLQVQDVICTSATAKFRAGF